VTTITPSVAKSINQTKMSPNGQNVFLNFFPSSSDGLVQNYDSFSTVFSNAKQQQFTLSSARPHFFFKVAQGT